MKNYFPLTHKETVDSYPYGRLRCTAFFSTEFKAGKGFRSVFQTINPKNGRVNAEKKSTYYPVLVMYSDSETGHIKHQSLDFYGNEGINRDCKFMAEHFELFTPAMISDIWAGVVTRLRAEVYALIAYCGADKDAAIKVINPYMEIAVKGYKDGLNLFADIIIDIPAIEAIKKPDFNPFKATTYTIGQ